MRVNSVTPVNIYPRPAISAGADFRERKSAYEHKNEERENINQINTTIRENSDGRVSFKGGAPLLHKAATFAGNNPLVAEALFAILVTCGLRPITILATAKSDEEKEKCSYQAAKSISSGVVGLGMTALVGTPIAAAVKKASEKKAFDIPPEMKAKSEEIVKKGVDALQNLAKKEGGEISDLISKLTKESGKLNLKVFTKKGAESQQAFIQKVSEKSPEIVETVEKAIKEQRIINNFTDTGKNVMNKLFQPVFMPLRAMVTIAMVPVLLNLLGLKKPAKKQPPVLEQNPQIVLNYNVFQTDNEKELFKSFAEVTKHEN